MRDALSLWLLLLALGAGGLVGCQSGPTADARELQPLTDAQGHPRSIAFTSPQHRVAVNKADLPPGQPWFAERNDHRRSVEAGVRAVEVERASTVTVDRQRSFRGRVFDSYRETTYRQQYSETWR